MAGEEHILGTIGPLSTSFEGCKLFVKTVLAGKPWLNEPSLLPFEWRELKDREKKLKVAVMWDDGVVRVHPPVTRALKEVVDKLKASKNVEVVDWTPYKHDGAWEIIVSPVQQFNLNTFIPRDHNLSLTDLKIFSQRLMKSTGKPLLRRRRRRRTSSHRSIRRTPPSPNRLHHKTKPPRPNAHHPQSLESHLPPRRIPHRVRQTLERS